MAPITWLLSGIVILIGAVITCVTGFGFQLIALPLFLLFLDTGTAIVFSALFAAAISVPVLWDSWQFAKPRQIAILGSGCVIGLPLGIFIQSQVSPNGLKLMIALLVVLFGALLAFGFSYQIKRENLGFLACGFLGGTLMTGAGLGGPVVALFLLNQVYAKDSFRANMAAFFIICGVGSIVALGVSGLMEGHVLLEALAFTPLITLSYFIGIKILPYVNTGLFRKIALAIVILAGLYGLVSAVLTMG